jgi:hypothetical protein
MDTIAWHHHIDRVTVCGDSYRRDWPRSQRVRCGRNDQQSASRLRTSLGYERVITAATAKSIVINVARRTAD